MKRKSGMDVSGRDRRDLLKTMTLAAGAVGLASVMPREVVLASDHQAEALLLSCMDFRLIDKTSRYMAASGLKEKYDHVVLAGAALGAVTEKYPEWNKTFWDHLALAIDLHKIHEVIILDHRDCGAYKLILGEDFSKDPKKETDAHTVRLKLLKKLIEGKYEKLKVELLLMDLAGKVEHV
ncbi:MAG: carbonic anhydrase [Pyrinomonadaceae bacterium]